MDAKGLKLFTKRIKEAFAAEADRARAIEMRRYMKSEMTDHGVPAPAQKKIFNAAFKQYPLFDKTVLYSRSAS